ncbi:MAG TPA: hypothetical protein VGL70_16530 [Candidatus Binatia bacterium]|jgi:hypothetical protein
MNDLELLGEAGAVCIVGAIDARSYATVVKSRTANEAARMIPPDRISISTEYILLIERVLRKRLNNTSPTSRIMIAVQKMRAAVPDGKIRECNEALEEAGGTIVTPTRPNW